MKPHDQQAEKEVLPIKIGKKTKLKTLACKVLSWCYNFDLLNLEIIIVYIIVDIKSDEITPFILKTGTKNIISNKKIDKQIIW